MPRKLTIFPIYLSGFWSFTGPLRASGAFNRLVLFWVVPRKSTKKKRKRNKSSSVVHAGPAAGRMELQRVCFTLQRRKSAPMVIGNCAFSMTIFLERIRRRNWRSFRLNFRGNSICFSRKRRSRFDGRFSLAAVFRQEMSIVSRSEASKDCFLQALLLGLACFDAR